MKSTMSTIKPQLIKRLNNELNILLTEEELDIILTAYFKQGRADLQNLSKLETAFIWGTLQARPKKMMTKINLYKTIKENFHTDKNRVTEEELNKLEKLSERCKELIEVWEHININGKTSRHKRRKQPLDKEHFKNISPNKNESKNHIT